MARKKPNHKRQLKKVEKQRKMLAEQLNELLQEARTSPIRHRYSPFPFGQVKRVILKMLDMTERKWLVKKWVGQKLKRENR
jgi:hypothetical protein